VKPVRQHVQAHSTSLRRASTLGFNLAMYGESQVQFGTGESHHRANVNVC